MPISREDVRRAAWWSVLAGANAGITYGASGVWHWFQPGERVLRDQLPMPHPWTEAVNLPGARDYGRLKAFLSRFEFGSLTPRQDLLVGGGETVRAADLPDDGTLLVYTPDSRPVTVDVDEFGGAVELRWYDPATGRSVAVDHDRSDSEVTVEAPPWDGDAVAVCDHGDPNG
jgi:hypothetical protein